MTQWIPKSIPKKREHVIAIRLSKFLYVFDLRQGAILIAVQHIALSACALLLLLVGIAHAQEMMDMLNADMEDNAEREGSILFTEDELNLQDAPFEATNNQQKFKIAQNLAMMIVFFLYGSLVGTAIYLVFCVALFYGAVKNKKEYIVPWTFCATFAALLMIGVLVIGDKSVTLTRICGGHMLYRFWSVLLIMGYFYCIIAVASFIYELKNVCKKMKISESTLQLNVEINEKNVLITKDATKNPINDSSVNRPVSDGNHV